MADYYQNSFLDDLGQEFAEPIAFNDMSSVTTDVIIANMKALCEENEIPASFCTSTVEISRGLFRKRTFNAVEIEHPNPPQNYCRQLYVLGGDSVHFFFVGNSHAFAEKNNYEAALNGTGGNFKAKMRAIAGIAPDIEPYEAEMAWHEAIYSAFLALVE